MAPPEGDGETAGTTCAADPIIIGPDLNASRAPLDTKLYRHVTLPNGLQAVLIQDTVALQHHGSGGGGGADEEVDDDDDDESSSEDDDDDDDRGGSSSCLRDSACCILVGAGSASDPPTCSGLAHYLEHLLFLGSEKYPAENDYDRFVAQHGGSDNAWTEWEHTAYELEIPAHALWGALDRLAQFFVAPLFQSDSVDRELRAIESEFQLHKNSDSTRRQQLLCSVSDPAHPMAKFSWGNWRSLREIPQQLGGVDPLAELRQFYDRHYYAANMRLVLQGAYTLDELQEGLVRYFSDVPPLPRDGGPPNQQLDALKAAGFPLPPRTLGTLTRIVPVKDRHELTITWQIPSQLEHWRSKPTDFLGHLMGHEASGSLLSYARRESWAVGCVAGTDNDEFATSHALFAVTFELSLLGLEHWRELVAAVYEYLGLLRQQCRQGWPPYIYEELRRIHELSYRYGDESAPDEVVGDLVENMAPHSHIPPERILDGSELLFEFDEVTIQSLLDEYMTPEKARIDLMSSSFGKPSDFDHDSADGTNNLGTDTIISNLVIQEEDENGDGTFNVEAAGEPQVDPMFGTQFWCHRLPASWLDQWTIAAEPGPPSIEMLGLPPRNPYVPENFDLKPRPDHDADHPLLNSSLKLCIAVGKTKQWFPASVVQYNQTKNAVLLSFEDEEEKWHTLDQPETHFTLESLTRTDSFEGSMDGKKIKFRIVSLARPGAKGAAVRMFGDESDLDVQDGTSFPPIPPPNSNNLPRQVANSNALKLWWLQDRDFKRPIAELRLQIICARANASPQHSAAAELLRDLCVDALLETSYLADMCELGSALEATDVGFNLRIHGFDDKMQDLFETTMKVLLSFRGKRDSLPDAIKEDRFEACKEVLERNYNNAGMTAAGLSSSARLQSMRTNVRSANQKLKALKSMDVGVFCETVASILESVAVEGLLHGNVDRNDADKTRDLILSMLESSGGAGLARKKYPPVSMLRIPSSSVGTHNLVVLPSKDPEEPNTACEVYIQVGKDNLRDRTLMDLMMHMMDEPLYAQLRTQDQFGYDVYCDVRWSYGIIGCIFHVTTNVKSADEVIERIDKFLVDYRQELVDMKKEDYHEHLVGLAKQKLDMFNSMSEETDCLWSEIRDGRFAWEVWRDEAVCLRSITKGDALRAFDDWLRPGQPRNMFAVQVIGAGETDASKGRPVVEADRLNDYIDEQVEAFHRLCKKQTWGRVNSKLF